MRSERPWSLCWAVRRTWEGSQQPETPLPGDRVEATSPRIWGFLSRPQSFHWLQAHSSGGGPEGVHSPLLSLRGVASACSLTWALAVPPEERGMGASLEGRRVREVTVLPASGVVNDDDSHWSCYRALWSPGAVLGLRLQVPSARV